MFDTPLLQTLKKLQLEGIFPPSATFEKIVIEPPKDPLHGDISTNAAFILSKQTQCSPRTIAEKIATSLKEHDAVQDVAIAGAGFVNLSLKQSYWTQCLRDILERGETYGQSTWGTGKHVNVEYVSANPTGPLHTGHGRGAVIADIIANLLKAVGYQVTREYYINDQGGQIDVLGQSILLRYREALGETITEIPTGCYPGEYLKDIALKAVKQFGQSLLEKTPTETVNVLKEFAVQVLMDDIRQDLKLIGVHQDVFTSEAQLHREGALDQAVSRLHEKNCVYKGILEKPKHLDDHWEQKPLLLFRSTQFGDQQDRPLKKTTGEWTYFAGDLAYHLDKIKRGFTHLIDVFGADHGSHVERLQAAVSALSDRSIPLEIILTQIVHFVRNGEPFKISKRAGNFVTMREIVEQLGPDVFRFMMASRKPDSQFTLDLDKALEQSKDNPVFYVQYAYARACSVLRAADVLFDFHPSAHLSQPSLNLLTDETELRLIKLMAEWPSQVTNAARTREPHRIIKFLEDLSHQFHVLWNKGKQDTVLRFLREDAPDFSQARVTLLKGMLIVLKNGLNLLGVNPLEEMR